MPPPILGIAEVVHQRVVRGGGALLVGLAIGAQNTALRWALEIAQVTILAGLPCLSLALTLRSGSDGLQCSGR